MKLLVTPSLLLVVCAASAVAFENSVFAFLDSGRTPKPLVTSVSPTPDALLTTISPVIDTCSAKCYLVVDQPPTHGESLSSQDKASLLSSKNAMFVDYVSGGLNVANIAERSASACKVELLKVPVGESSSTDIVESKKDAANTVILVDAKSSGEAIQWVEKVRSVFGDDYVIMIASSKVEVRQPSQLANLANLAVNATAPLDANSSLLSRYMIFSPGVWMGFLVSFIFVAIALVGILLLQSIKTPLRFEAKPKAI